MRIAIVGSGYVGLVSAACLAEKGHNVVCVDVDADKVDRIGRGVAPIHEPSLDELLMRGVRSRKLSATTDLRAAVTGAEVTFLAVGTPFDGRNIDLSYIRKAAEDVGAALEGAKEYHVICVKSTVVPGTTEQVVGVALEKTSGRRIGTGLGLAMNPEFLAEGTAVQDFMKPDRIVIGASDERAAAVIRECYAPFGGTDVLVTNLSTAEMIKYAANSFLATVISFTNEIANLSESIEGVDATQVMAGVHLDRRLSPILPSGRVRPGLMSFLYPGTGFGGSCFPKDVRALIAFGNQRQQPMPLLSAVMDTNARQPDVTVRLCRDQLGGVEGRRIAVLGLAFKPGTDDVRESPAGPIIRALVGEGAKVTAHDPLATENMRAVLSDVAVNFAATLADAVKDADAVVLVTSWPEYGDLHTVLGDRDVVVVDGRRFLDRGKFRQYRGIGLRHSETARPR